VVGRIILWFFSTNRRGAFGDELRLGIELPAALAAKEIGVNSENHFNRTVGNLLNRIADLIGKVVFDPSPDKEIGYANLDIIFFQHKVRGIFEPDFMPLLADLLGDAAINFVNYICTRGTHSSSPFIIIR